MIIMSMKLVEIPLTMWHLNNECSDQLNQNITPDAATGKNLNDFHIRHLNTHRIGIHQIVADQLKDDSATAELGDPS